MKTKRSIAIAVVATVLALAASGCATVRPWERDHLARYGMRPDRDRLEMGMNDHLFFSREAVHGGRAIGGGGCGCN